LIDLSHQSITGKAAENALEKAGITVNKNMVPFDTKSPFITSGIRLGTPALTTRGFTEQDMKTIAGFIHRVLMHMDDESVQDSVQNEIKEFGLRYPVYGTLV
jgi:glycine hydroxymethyltransferase